MASAKDIEVEVTVSAEALVHKEMIALIKKAQKEYGIRIESINVSWAQYIAGNSQLFEVRLDTALEKNNG